MVIDLTSIYLIKSMVYFAFIGNKTTKPKCRPEFGFQSTHVSVWYVDIWQKSRLRPKIVAGNLVRNVSNPLTIKAGDFFADFNETISLCLDFKASPLINHEKVYWYFLYLLQYFLVAWLNLLLSYLWDLHNGCDIIFICIKISIYLYTKYLKKKYIKYL